MLKLRLPGMGRCAWLVSAVGLGVALVLVLGPWLFGGVSAPFERVLLIAALVNVCCVGAIVLVGLVRRQPARIELGADTLVLPGSLTPQRPQRISYADVEGVHPWRFVGMEGVVLARRGRIASRYPRRAFVSPDGPEAFLTGVREGVARLPDGKARLAEFDARAASARVVGERVPWLSLGLALVLCAVFLLEVRLGAVENPSRLIELGGNARLLLTEGELFRVVTANFLHANALHLAVNMVVLLVLGFLVETLVGALRTGVVAACGGLGGAVVSAWWNAEAVSVGASPALLGLVGGMLVVAARYRRELPGNFLVPRWWWPTFGVLALAGEALPRVDHAGHAGGLAAGTLAALATIRGVPLSEMARHRSPALIGAALLLGAVVVVGLVAGAYHAAGV